MCTSFSMSSCMLFLQLFYKIITTMIFVDDPWISIIVSDSVYCYTIYNEKYFSERIVEGEGEREDNS